MMKDSLCCVLMSVGAVSSALIAGAAGWLALGCRDARRRGGAWVSTIGAAFGTTAGLRRGATAGTGLAGFGETEYRRMLAAEWSLPGFRLGVITVSFRQLRGSKLR